MSLTIWDYPLAVQPYNIIDMPFDAVILSLQVQNNKPVIWASVDPDEIKEKRTFVMVPTGGIVPGKGRFIGTVQIESITFDATNINPLPFVFHIFEILTR